MNNFKKIFFSLLAAIATLFLGCEQINPDKFYGYVPEDAVPYDIFIPTDTLQNGSIRYCSDEYILVVGAKGDTIKARFDPNQTSDLIVKKGKHPETILPNRKVFVEYYYKDNVPWILGAGYFSLFMDK